MACFEPPSARMLSTKGRIGTLGMFIIDHFEVRDEAGNAVPADAEEIGGGGIYARAFLPPTHCGLIVDRGDDFPEQFARDLESFGSEMVWFRHRTGKTTRALNMYSGHRIGEGHQSFRYLSPQLNLSPRDLILDPSPFAKPILPEWIHVVCNTTRAQLIVDELVQIRSHGLTGGLGKGWGAQMVWEPLPVCCKFEELDNILRLAPSFAVFSPNLLELESILGIVSSDTPTASNVVEAAEQFHTRLVQSCGDPAKPAIIVRAGELGSYTLSSDWRGWVPAFWTEADQDRVVDPTGGGNAFMGGLCAGLLISKGDIRSASIYAATAASFAIQQRGLPHFTREHRGEVWNRDDPWRRLKELVRRVEELEQSQKVTMHQQ
ncbi:hypothetical protein CI109_107302 [Kwoniella shandongensis]|uniref:Carbohydrate kinase PfkB domain-containing protein n=1 Tax=Kwoniella shandongensis TaxID=1734106 RepID=A0AAJ8N0R3_9TREE